MIKFGISILTQVWYGGIICTHMKLRQDTDKDKYNPQTIISHYCTLS